ncbi:MAG TPA: CocE/NonD family hydrolase [Pyrinomonadaceae bacterium]|nr:CocE/NonD family hydrolase [Pyrinomonadaceae bacterium]
MLRRSVLFVIILAAFVASVFAQLSQQEQADLANYIKENYTKREVRIPMRDGVKLFAEIYEPKDKSQKYPIMMNRTPYSVGPYGEGKFKGSLGPDFQFAREGYIFVYEDVRGRYMSEGQFLDERPQQAAHSKPTEVDESTDTYDTIDWLIKNVPNNNGRVGLTGISYPGFYTSSGEINSHPALKACSPQAPVSDWFHGDDMHHNGALFLAQNWRFFAIFGQERPTPVPDNSNLRPWTGPDESDQYNFFLNAGGLKEVADLYQKGLGVRIKFWDEMMQHPDYDAYWKAHNILTQLKNITCPTMTVGGWYDNEDLYGALQTYQHIERQNPGLFNVLVVGPWYHGGWAGIAGDWLGTAYFEQKTGDYFRKNMQLQFFNHFLKDKGDISAIHEVNLFDTGSHEWRSFDNYSPTNAKDTALYLTANGGLSFTMPAGNSGFDEYVSDPMNPVPYTQKIIPVTAGYPRDFMTEDQRFAATRPDVLVYQTAPLDRDITVAGDIKPSLFVSSTGTDSDFVVKLIDVFPDDYKYPNGVTPPFESSVFEPGGYEMLLRGEPMPARLRNGFEKPVALTPNTPTKLAYVMPGIAHTFKKGHRIMVQIQSTWFPLVARNPQQFVSNYQLATNADFRKATERVYYGGQDASAVILPILNR